MWAFYAENFNGVCLEIDFKELDLSIINNKGYIEYEKEKLELLELESLDYNKETLEKFLKYENENFNKLYLTKTKQWSYEQEYRIFTNEDYLPLNTALKRILVWGSKDLTIKRSEIISRLLSNKLSDINVARCNWYDEEQKIKIQQP